MGHLRTFGDFLPNFFFLRACDSYCGAASSWGSLLGPALRPSPGVTDFAHPLPYTSKEYHTQVYPPTPYTELHPTLRHAKQSKSQRGRFSSLTSVVLVTIFLFMGGGGGGKIK